MVAWKNKVGLDINLSGSPTSWMTITPSISLVHAHANGKYQGINLHVDDFSWSGNLELNLNSKKHTEFQALFSYHHQQRFQHSKLKRITISIWQSNKASLIIAFKSVSPFPTSSTLPNGKPVQTRTPIVWQITAKKPPMLTGSG